MRCLQAERCRSLPRTTSLRSGDVEGIGAGDYVRLAVKDTGTGISPEHLEKVMEPFFTTKELGKGSGLGLSMVYGFAKQSNGAFLVQSELGAGTTAELWLPRAPATAVPEACASSEADNSISIPAMRVLLVDDHEEVRETTAAVLRDLGHEVVEAANGTQALERLNGRHSDFDLLVTDYAMPLLSGADFLREARDICPGVPALIITGYAEPDMIQGLPKGVQTLLKPFTPRALERAMARVHGSDALNG